MSNFDPRKDEDRAYLAGALTAYALGLKPEEVLSGGRGSPAEARGRQVAMYLLRASFGMSLSRVLEHLAASSALGVRLRAAAGRFQADYHLAASSGGLRTDAPGIRAAASGRLLAVENSLGPDGAGMAELLVLDRLTVSALQHRTGAGLDEARDVLVQLAGAYGLTGPDQEAGRALASS